MSFSVHSAASPSSSRGYGKSYSDSFFPPGGEARSADVARSPAAALEPQPPLFNQTPELSNCSGARYAEHVPVVCVFQERSTREHLAELRQPCLEKRAGLAKSRGHMVLSSPACCLRGRHDPESDEFLDITVRLIAVGAVQALVVGVRESFRMGQENAPLRDGHLQTLNDVLPFLAR